MSRWNTVAIYGVGLIGGSIGMALRRREQAGRVVGIGRNTLRLEKAVELGAVTEFVTDLDQLPTPDCVVLCTPVQRLTEHCREVSRRFPSAWITDVGSTKQKLVSEIEQHCPDAQFIGSHPLAGSDRSGVENADPDLFRGRVAIVTPTSSSNPRLIQEVTAFWNCLEAQTTSMSPEAHDRALAITSHLPHVLAAALAAETPDHLLSLIAGGWRDTTRIAAADVELWTQILQENNENVVNALRSLQARLRDFETALDANQRDSLMRLLAAGKQRRDALGS